MPTITTRLLAELKPKDSAYDVRDDRLRGFLVRVNQSGKMRFMCQYARGKRASIGNTDSLSIAQARDLAKAILADVAKGIDPAAEVRKRKQECTFAEFINKHYAPWAEAHLKSHETSTRRIARNFIPLMGKKPLKEISSLAVDKWRAQSLKKGLSAQTVNREVATLKAAMSKAVQWDMLEQHPLASLKLLKVDTTPNVRYLSTTEEAALRDALIQRETALRQRRDSANQWRRERHRECLPARQAEFVDHLRPMVLLSLNTGMRQGETFLLEWKNVHFDEAIITIAGTHAKSGKTRHIPLNEEALQVLRDWYTQSPKSTLVFPGKNGFPLNNVRKAWTRVLTNAKIKHFRWHDMRHHFASQLVMLGVDLNTVRELLGHSDIKMTLRYAHLAPEHKANAVKKLDSLRLSSKTTSAIEA